MMFLIPLFSVDLYRDSENAWDYLLAQQYQLLTANPTDVTTDSIIGLINYEIKDFSTQDNFVISYTTPFN